MFMEIKAAPLIFLLILNNALYLLPSTADIDCNDFKL